MGRDHSSVAHPAYTVQLINHGRQEYLLGDESMEHSYSLCLYSHVASCVSANRFIVAQLLTGPFVYMAGEFESYTFQARTNHHRYSLVFDKEILITVDISYSEMKCPNLKIPSKLTNMQAFNQYM